MPGRDVTGSAITGAKSSIGATALQISSTVRALDKGVDVKADDDNTGVVYVGALSTITAGSADATDGFRLNPGQSVFLAIDDISKVYVIGSTTGQKVWFAGY